MHLFIFVKWIRKWFTVTTKKRSATDVHRVSSSRVKLYRRIFDLHNFRRMCSDASVRAHIGRINVVLGRMSEQLSSRVTRTTERQASVRVRKLGRNSVAISYIMPRVIKNDCQHDPKQPEPKDVEIIHLYPCFGRRSCFPFGMILGVVQRSNGINVNQKEE